MSADAPRRAVIDASVAVKLFVPEELSPQAQALFKRLNSPGAVRLFVPGLFFIECASVFRKWASRFGYPEKSATANIDDLLSLGLEVIPTEILTPEAFRLALHYEVSAYDACYLAAASLAGMPFITADRKLVKGVTERGRQGGLGRSIEVIWLGQVEEPSGFFHP